MSLACTLLGHRYGDPEVRHEREERGEEVVTVTREVATCERCGELRVLSETTEVTAVVDREAVEAGEADAATDDGDAEEPGTATDAPDPDPSATGSDPAPDPGTDEGVEIVETGPQDEEPGDATGGNAGPDAPDPDGAGAPAGSDDPGNAPPAGETPGVAEEAPDADEDDGVILEDEDGEREYGQWPDHDDQWEPEPVDEADVAAGQADPDDEDEDEDEDEAEGDDGPSFEEVDPGRDLPDTYSCPSCGFVTEAAGSALRAGDACPDCGEAYLVADGTERDR